MATKKPELKILTVIDQTKPNGHISADDCTQFYGCYNSRYTVVTMKSSDEKQFKSMHKKLSQLSRITRSRLQNTQF